LETPVNCHSELMEDPLRNIGPVQLRVASGPNAIFDILMIDIMTGEVVHDGQCL